MVDEELWRRTRRRIDCLKVGGRWDEEGGRSVMGAHRGSSSPIEEACSCGEEVWTIFWSADVDIVAVFVLAMQLPTP